MLLMVKICWKDGTVACSRSHARDLTVSEMHEIQMDRQGRELGTDLLLVPCACTKVV